VRSFGQASGGPRHSCSVLAASRSDQSPAAHVRLAEDYYEISVDTHAAAHIYTQRPLSEDVVRVLNPDLSIADLAYDLANIAYPSL
jgi:hypothetical protein